MLLIHRQLLFDEMFANFVASNYRYNIANLSFACVYGFELNLCIEFPKDLSLAIILYLN